MEIVVTDQVALLYASLMRNIYDRYKMWRLKPSQVDVIHHLGRIGLAYMFSNSLDFNDLFSYLKFHEQVLFQRFTSQQTRCEPKQNARCRLVRKRAKFGNPEG